jgi:hypothetical protein
MAKPTDCIRGTLDLVILETISLEPEHGWAIAKRVQQVFPYAFGTEATRKGIDKLDPSVDGHQHRSPGG